MNDQSNQNYNFKYFHLQALIVVIANIRPESNALLNENAEQMLHRGNNFCSREKIKHFKVNINVPESLFEPFIYLAGKLTLQTKSSFPQLRQLTQKSQKNE